MKINLYTFLYAVIIFSFQACGETKKTEPSVHSKEKTTISAPKADTIKPAALLPEKYLPLLRQKKVALIANQTARVNDKHLLDFLLENKIEVVKIFSPEHGFRGQLERGKTYDKSIDEKTGLPIVPMYGRTRKPKAKDLQGVDVMVFDIQDVGVRFYTYISSMHLAMEAAAENNVDFIVLDRPNPLGDYVDGPVLQLKFKSFVGMHPIPVVHGLTVGELAQMINGEAWLANGLKCNLSVVKCENYKHNKTWSLAVKPSPNLPNDLSIRLYPSLCFFEATNVSIGRGTKFPFQVIGYPDSSLGNFSFTPKDLPGFQTNPIQENKICYGEDLRNEDLKHKFSLKYFIKYFNTLKASGTDIITRPKWFNLLAGNDSLLKQIRQGQSESEIRNSWSKDLEEYKKIRKKYLLYPD